MRGARYSRDKFSRWEDSWRVHCVLLSLMLWWMTAWTETGFCDCWKWMACPLVFIWWNAAGWACALVSGNSWIWMDTAFFYPRGSWSSLHFLLESLSQIRFFLYCFKPLVFIVQDVSFMHIKTHDFIHKWHIGICFTSFKYIVHPGAQNQSWKVWVKNKRISNRLQKTSQIQRLFKPSRRKLHSRSVSRSQHSQMNLSKISFSSRFILTPF